MNIAALIQLILSISEEALPLVEKLIQDIHGVSPHDQTGQVVTQAHADLVNKLVNGKVQPSATVVSHNKTLAAVLMPDKFVGDFTTQVPAEYGKVIEPLTTTPLGQGINLVTAQNWVGNDPGTPVVPNFATDLGQQGGIVDSKGNEVFAFYGTAIALKATGKFLGYLTHPNVKNPSWIRPGMPTMSIGITQWEFINPTYVVTNPPA